MSAPTAELVDLTVERMARVLGRLAKTQHELVTLERLQRRNHSTFRAALIEGAREELAQAKAELEDLKGYNVSLNLECDECMQGWDAHKITVNLPTMTSAEALERLRKLA